MGFYLCRQAVTSPYFGFIEGHSHLRAEHLERIGSLVAVADASPVAAFERSFSELIGKGQSVSYASARMGFYDLMKVNGIGKGDEVILPGATCSVMVNAVLRTGASPVFSDIDPNTFGSSLYGIKQCASPRTRMIVAQHSFGIPCEILAISTFAREMNIFLLEDCALTLGSKVEGRCVGSFGQAALFSTDHTKPINTIIGGLIYTEDADLACRLRTSRDKSCELPKSRQRALWRRLLLERYFCVPERYGRLAVLDAFQSKLRRLLRVDEGFLSEDYSPAPSSSYPYPARMPAFLAEAGLIELERWPAVAQQRKENFTAILGAVCGTSSASYLPTVYQDPTLEIIPLRLAWSQPCGALIRKRLATFMSVSSTWFITPIVSTDSSLGSFGYHSGTCMVSESIGPNMINVPCIHTPASTRKLSTLLGACL